MKRMWKSKIFWMVLVAAIACWFWLRPFSTKNNTMNIGIVQKGDLVQRVTIAGGVIPNRKTVISAPYAGYVRKVFVKIGQKVSASDPIVSVSQSLKGGDDDVFPLRAPFGGTVVQVLKMEGEYVEQSSGQSENSGLVRIDDLTQMFVSANAPESEIAKLKVGQEVEIKVAAVLHHSYHGKIKQIFLSSKDAKDFERSKVEFPILIQINDQDENLKPGLSAIIDIITNQRKDVLTLRHEFMLKEGGKTFVVTEAGERKEISVGMRDEEQAEVVQGLTAGERIRQTDFVSLLKAGM